jgi:hypothetical protein
MLSGYRLLSTLLQQSFNFPPPDMNKYSSTTYCFTSGATRLTITTNLHMVWVLLLVPLPKRTGIDLDIQINNDPLRLLIVFIVYTYIPYLGWNFFRLYLQHIPSISWLNN